MLSIGPVIECSLCDSVSHGTVSVIVHHRTDGAINRQFLPVDAQSADLSIEIAKVSALQQRVV